MERLQNVNTAQRAEGIGCPCTPRIWPLELPAAGWAHSPRAALLRAAYLARCSSPPTEVQINPAFPLPAQLIGSPSFMGGSLRTPLPCLAASHSGVPGGKCSHHVVPSHPPPPRVKHASGAGLGMAFSPPHELLASPKAGPSGKNGPTTCRLPARPPRPAQPPPARPAEPARVARAGGSRPPPRYKGRRRFRRIAFPFPPYLNLGVSSLPLLYRPRPSAPQDRTSLKRTC